MRHMIHSFLNDETGAVTVDWTVLAAAVVGLGVASVGAVRTGVVSLGGDIQGSLDRSASVVALGELGDDNYDGLYVQSSGRGTASSSYQCARGGGCWTTQYMTMSYLMEDGSYWTMRSVQEEGQEAVVTWTDSNRDVVEAPRFRDS